MRTFRLLVLSCVAIVLMLGNAGGAAAESVSGGSSPYDGLDPVLTGCNVDAYEVNTYPVTDRSSGNEVARVQIFYSRSCGTNWVRVTANPYGGTATKFVESDAGGWNSESDAGTGSSYSMMIYAPGDTAISGYVYLFEAGVNEWNSRAEGFFSY